MNARYVRYSDNRSIANVWYVAIVTLLVTIVTLNLAIEFNFSYNSDARYVYNRSSSASILVLAIVHQF